MSLLTRLLLPLVLVASAAGCTAKQLVDDPKAVNATEGVGFVIVDSDTRVQTLFLRKSDNTEDVAIHNLAPGVQVAAFAAPPGDYCLKRMHLVGLGINWADPTRCFPVTAGATAYLFHIKLRNNKLRMRRATTDGFHRFRERFPKLAGSLKSAQ